MNKFSDEELLELYGQGLTNREIAHHLDFHSLRLL